MEMKYSLWVQYRVDREFKSICTYGTIDACKRVAKNFTRDGLPQWHTAYQIRDQNSNILFECADPNAKRLKWEKI